MKDMEHFQAKYRILHSTLPGYGAQCNGHYDFGSSNPQQNRQLCKPSLSPTMKAIARLIDNKSIVINPVYEDGAVIFSKPKKIS